MAPPGGGMGLFGRRPEKKALRVEPHEQLTPVTPAVPPGASGSPCPSTSTTTTTSSAGSVENVPPSELGDKRSRAQRRLGAAAPPSCGTTLAATPLAPTPESSWLRPAHDPCDLFASPAAPSSRFPNTWGAEGAGVADEDDDNELLFPEFLREEAEGPSTRRELAFQTPPSPPPRAPPADLPPPAELPAASSPPSVLRLAAGGREPAEAPLPEPQPPLTSPPRGGSNIDPPPATSSPAREAPVPPQPAAVVDDAEAAAEQRMPLASDGGVLGRDAATARWRAMNGGAQAVLAGALPENLLQRFPCNGIISGADCVLVVLSAFGSAAACGLLPEGAPQDAAVLAPALRQQSGTAAFLPHGQVDGQYRIAGRKYQSHSRAAGAQMAFGGVPACPTLAVKVALQSAEVEAAVRGAGREPVILGADPTHLEVVPPAGASDGGRTVLLKLASLVLVVNGYHKVGHGAREEVTRKAEEQRARASALLQLLAAFVIIASMVGQAREDAGLPTRSADEAARALAAILPADADPSQWVAVVLPGGVALPMPRHLHAALVALLEVHGRKHRPSTAPTGATGLGLQHFGLGGPE